VRNGGGTREEGGMLFRIHSTAPPSHSLSPPPPSVDAWCREFVRFTGSGRLWYLGRIANIIGHLEGRAQGTGRYLKVESADVHFFKNHSSLILVSFLFHPRALHSLFSVLDKSKFTFKNIYNALNTGEIAPLIHSPLLPLPSNSSIPLFLFLLLYLKLVSNTPGASEVSQLFANLKLSPPEIDFPIPVSLFISALSERRVRFFDSPNQQLGMSRTEQLEYQRSVLYFNELFELAEINYLTKIYKHRKLLHSIMSAAHNPSHFNSSLLPVSHSLVSTQDTEQIQQFHESIARIEHYVGYSDNIVMCHMKFLSEHRTLLLSSHFSLSNVQLFLTLLELYSLRGDGTNVVCYALNLLSTWSHILFENKDTINESHIDLVLKAVSIVEQRILNTSKIKKGEMVSSMCFLGSSIGVLGSDCKSFDLMIKHLQTSNILYSEIFGGIAIGIGDAMIAVHTPQLIELMKVVLLKTPQSSTKPYHSIQRALIILRLFQRVFISRILQKDCFSKQHPQDNWLASLTDEIHNTYFTKKEIRMERVESMFAAGGLLKGIATFFESFQFSEWEKEIVEQSKEKMIEVIEDSVKERESMKVEEGKEYERYIGIGGVNTDIGMLSKDTQSRLGEVIVSVFVESMVPIQSVLSSDLPSVSSTIMDVNTEQETLFKQTRNLIDGLSILFPNLPEQQQQDTIIRLHESACKLYHSFSSFVMSHPKLYEKVERKVKRWIGIIFLAYNSLFALIFPLLSPPLSLLALDALSYLQFDPIKSPIYHRIGQQLGIRAMDSEDNIVALLRLIPNLNGTNELEKKRSVFYLNVIVPVVSTFPDKLLQQYVFPSLFEGLCSENISVNKQVTEVFIALFLSLSPLPHPPPNSFELGKKCTAGSGMRSEVMEVIPYYLNKCLDSYPNTLLLDSFHRSLVSIFYALNPTHPLSIYCFKELGKKIISVNEWQQFTELKPLFLIFVQLLEIVDIKVLDVLLETITEVVRNCKQEHHQTMCSLINHIILNNFDYTRKSKCFNWYLKLLASVNLNTESLENDGKGRETIMESKL